MGKVSELIKNLVALVTAVGGLVSTAKAFWPAPGAVPFDWRWLVAASALFALTLSLGWTQIVRRVAPRSELVDRGALDLPRRTFVGREDELDHLLGLLTDSALVMLVGESGSGKSCLLSEGVVKRLITSKTRLPLLIENWQADWVEGPRESLADALQQVLDESMRKALDAGTVIHPETAVETLSKIRGSLGRMPILLFDQFDDYLARHHERFLIRPQGRLVTKTELLANNSFWREIDSLLATGTLHCLFSIREEAAWALECVRFLEPRTFPLPRLARASAESLINMLTAGDKVVARPDKGFVDLKRRILDDLAAEGALLPIEMRLAFKGLAYLPDLTPGAYFRAGGLRGLESLHLSVHLASSARSAGFTRDDIRSLLVSMVTTTSPHKTIPRTPSELLEALPLALRNASQLDTALAALESSEIIRPLLVRGADSPVWQLDHDFLSEVVVELDRRAHQWSQLLDTASHAFRSAPTLRERWKRLLPPSLQIRIHYERLRDHLRYGSNLRFIVLSTIRLAVNSLTMAMALAFLLWHRYQLHETALSLLTPMAAPGVTLENVEALWKLTKPSGAQRDFLSSALDSEVHAMYFLQHSPAVRVSILGVSSKRRSEILQNVVSDHCQDSYRKGRRQSAVIARACLDLMTEMRDPSTEELTFVASELASSITIEDLKKIYSLNGRNKSLASDMIAQYMLKTWDREQPFGKLDLLIDNLSPRLRSQARVVVDQVDYLGLPLDKLMTALSLRRHLGLATDREAASSRISALIEESGGAYRDQSIRTVEPWLLPPDALSLAVRYVRGGRRIPISRLKLALDSVSSTDMRMQLMPLVMDELSKTLSSGNRGALDRLAFIFLGARDRLTHEEVSRYVEAEAALSRTSPGVLVFSHLSLWPTSVGRGNEFMDLLKSASQSDPVAIAKFAFGCPTPSLMEPSIYCHYFFETLHKVPTPILHQVWKIIFDLSLRNEYTGRESLALLETVFPKGTLDEEVKFLVTMISQTRDSGRKVYCWLLLSDMADRLPSSLVRDCLDHLISLKKPLERPSCEDFVKLARVDTRSTLVEVLKWPTCSQGARKMLVARMGEIDHEDLGRHFPDGDFDLDPWKLNAWARKWGLDAESPPVFPRSIQERVGIKATY